MRCFPPPCSFQDSCRRLAAAGLLLGMVLPALALTWEKHSVEVKLDAGKGSLEVEFPFKNEGAEPVTISELKSSCGCAEPTVVSRSIPAGGAGVVKVVYTPGDRVGPQSAQLVVRTDEKGVSPELLRLRVDIQPAISTTPRLVQWTKADGGVSRVIEIKQLTSGALRLRDIKPAGDTLTIDLKPGTEPGTWRLTLTPKAVEKPFTTKVEIPVTVGERTVTYSVFAVVRP